MIDGPPKRIIDIQGIDLILGIYAALRLAVAAQLE
jgi:hypothetical protein